MESIAPKPKRNEKENKEGRKGGKIKQGKQK